jgi:phosphatidylglycerophosphate synthase
MSDGPSIRRSIVLSVFSYFAIQCAIWVIAVGPAAAVDRPLAWFFAAAAALHIGMGAFLWWRRSDFLLIESRRPLARVNAACHLTLFRLSSAPVILFLAIAVADDRASGLVLVVLVAVAFASDFLDGQVARKLRQTTVIGSYLDSSTDYAVLMVLSVAFLVLGITPLWYFCILMGRLAGFALAMGVVARVHGTVIAETTFIGKAAVFSAMVAYAFELARHVGLRGPGDPTVVLVVEILSAGVLVVSVADKLVYLVRRFRGREAG